MCVVVDVLCCCVDKGGVSSWLVGSWVAFLNAHHTNSKKKQQSTMTAVGPGVWFGVLFLYCAYSGVATTSIFTTFYNFLDAYKLQPSNTRLP